MPVWRLCEGYEDIFDVYPELRSVFVERHEYRIVSGDENIKWGIYMHLKKKGYSPCATYEEGTYHHAGTPDRADTHISESTPRQRHTCCPVVEPGAAPGVTERL